MALSLKNNTQGDDFEKRMQIFSETVTKGIPIAVFNALSGDKKQGSKKKVLH